MLIEQKSKCDKTVGQEWGSSAIVVATESMVPLKCPFDELGPRVQLELYRSIIIHIINNLTAQKYYKIWLHTLLQQINELSVLKV